MDDLFNSPADAEITSSESVSELPTESVSETLPVDETSVSDTIPVETEPAATLAEETVPIEISFVIPMTEATVADETEWTESTIAQDDLVVEQLQQQTQYQGYICGFLLFFTVALLCTYVYKLFRLFF